MNTAEVARLPLFAMIFNMPKVILSTPEPIRVSESAMPRTDCVSEAHLHIIINYFHCLKINEPNIAQCRKNDRQNGILSLSLLSSPPLRIFSCDFLSLLLPHIVRLAVANLLLTIIIVFRCVLFCFCIQTSTHTCNARCMHRAPHILYSPSDSQERHY